MPKIKPNFPWSIPAKGGWTLGPKVEFKGASRRAFEKSQKFARGQQAQGIHKTWRKGGRVNDFRAIEGAGEEAGADVNSTAVKNIWWEDAASFLANGGRKVGTVKIQYQSGPTIYDFPNVPWQEYLRLVNAPSIGHYLYIYFRPKFSTAG